jgi:septum formation protein
MYLASGSPRRRELLQQLAIPFKRVSPDVIERRASSETPLEYVRRVAGDKARAGLEVSRETRLPPLPVLGADTAVVLGDEVFGKPVNREDARNMLARLSGRSHQVITAVAVADQDRCLLREQISTVEFLALDEAAIAAYCQTEEPMDKAGAYAIQGLAAAFVSRVDGSYSGVMGLPLCETVALLGEFGVIGIESIAALMGRHEMEETGA